MRRAETVGGAGNSLGALIAGELERLGATVSVEAQKRVGDHILGRWGASPEGGILLLCHFDTVHPIGTLNQNPCVEREGRLYGPGTQDMKAGITAVLGAAAVLRERGVWPDRPVKALFTTDEEAGSLTSRPMIEARSVMKFFAS